MLKESQTLELKREVTDGLKREVIAFANTNGGEIYIGVEDDGTVVGLPNAQKDLEAVSSMLHDSIRPDILVHTTAEIITIDGKDIIKIIVSRGTRRPYHIASKGMKPSAVFVRHGTSVSNASDEAIRQMIIESDGSQYEVMRSLNQELTFHEAKAQFEQLDLSFEEQHKRTLGLINQDGYYTNLGLLLSDQCEHSIKCGRYDGVDKLHFQDRKEFNGSILKQVNDTYEYIQLHNAKAASFEGLNRIEHTEYPEYAIREALINAVVHRDYSFSSSILIHIFDNRIEIVSVGGLVQGLTLEDIELGISQSRNPKLANCFYRIKWIESYGTGLQRIKESYKNFAQQPFWQVGPNSFVVTLPKQTLSKLQGSNDLILKWIKEQEEFTAKDLERYLDKSKSSVRHLLEQLIEAGVIKRVGKGRATRYKRT